MDDFSVESLSRTTNISAQVKSQINEVFLAVKQKIKDAHRIGSDYIVFELADNFAIANYDPLDGQLIVYSELVERLSNGGFDVKIEMNEENGNRLHIKWRNLLNPADKDRMKMILRKYEYKQKDAAKN